MNKVILNRFIEKYHLSGNVNSVVLTTDKNTNTLKTRFMSGDKSLLGELSMEGWGYGFPEIGIYDTETLIKLLSVLSDDIDLNLNVSGDKAVSLAVGDKTASVNYMLSDLSVINKPPKLKKVPTFELKIKVDANFIKKFIAGKGALPETDSFTVVVDEKNGVTAVIGYSSINTNRVTIPVETESYEKIRNVSFNANLFKDVLYANKECESATFEVSSKGLACINFNVDKYDATYYFVAKDDID